MCLPIFLQMQGIDVDPTLGNPQAAALALQDRQVFGCQLMLTAILPKADECGGHWIEFSSPSTVARFSRCVPIDGQISERIVLLDCRSLSSKVPRAFRNLGTDTGEMPIRRSRDQ